MKALKTSLQVAPELTLEDLNDIKIPAELFEIIPLAFCRKHKILPLRLDQMNGIFSFLFVDHDLDDEVETFRKKNGWAKISAYRISKALFKELLTQCEKSEQESSGAVAVGTYGLALIENDSEIKSALTILLQKQGYSIFHFESEEEFKTDLKKHIDEIQEQEDEIINIAENRKIIPYRAVLVRKEVLLTPKTFCDSVWAHAHHIKISILEDRWLHSALETSLTSSKNISSDLDFHLKHDDFYHAALECIKQGNLFQAVELLEQVQQDNAYYIKSKLVLGKAFLKKKNYNKASTHFQKAYDHWCEDPDAIVNETTLSMLYHLAFTFEKIHRLDDALRLYERVAAENPLYREVSAHMARVKDHQRKALSEREKKEGLPAFSKAAREKSRYDKIDELGRGGMGIVYRSRDSVLGREVALKILNSHFKHDEKIVETFLREAKSLAALNHLNIVTIFDAGIEAGNYYIAMEFIEGRTVRELLKKKGYFKLGTAIALSKQVLKALSYAHSKHVIHRDITTNNMMLTDTKIIKLMDFGLARIVNQLHSEQSIIGGTPYFMSPEQVEGAPIDHRTDIYSFGVCLFEMVTGKVPFPMENPGYHHLHTPAPDPRTIKPHLNDEIAKIIAKCLQKKPGDRYATADDVLEAIKKVPINDGEVSNPRRITGRKRS